MKLGFRHYVLATLLVTFGAVYHAYVTRRQFYNAAIWMTTNKLNVVVLGNLAFLLLVLLGKALKRVFLGQLTRDEIEDLVQNSKYTITETMLALTIFREELNIRLLMLFTGLLFMKIFHWLAAMRVESIARSVGISTWAHIRLLALLGLLAIIDWSFVAIIGVSLMQTRQPSVLLLFGFEYLILSVALASTFFKYILLVLDARWEAKGVHWNNKNAWLFYLEFTADLVRLFLYLIFFMIICSQYGLPLHLIRELGITFYNLRERIIKFIHFCRITKNMKERFPDATAEELAAGDKTCIVCREDMEVGSTKRLPCGHMFHFPCLRTWLERSTSCPTCRVEIPANAPPAAAAAHAPNAAAVARNNAAVAAAPAVVVAPAAQPAPVAQAPAPQPQPQQTPPPPPQQQQPLVLPPHIQAHIDALRAAQEVKGSSPTLPLHPALLAPQPQHPFAAAPLFSPAPLHSPLHVSPVAGAPFGSFLPPPPPPPPPHLFSAPPSLMIHSHPHLQHLAQPHQHPSLSVGGGGLTSFPTDPLYAAYVSHHSMLLQHHFEFLTSSLAQVKILMAQQQEMQAKFMEQQQKMSGNAAATTATVKKEENQNLVKENATKAASVETNETAQ